MRKVSTDTLLVVGLLALNGALKFGWLGVNEISNDEPFTIFWSQQDLADLFAMLRTENNPPLYFLLVKWWSGVVPLHAAWLRVPSALFSALTVWPLFLLSRRLGGKLLGITACSLFTFSNYHFGFAHEVRAYSLFCLLSVMSMWLLIRMAHAPKAGIPSIVAWALINALLVYTHFFGWLMIGVLGLCVWWVIELRAARRPFLIATGITLLAYTPYCVVFLERFGQTAAHGTWIQVPPAEEIWNMVRRWSNQPVVAIGLLIAIVVCAFRKTARNGTFIIGLLWGVLPMLLMYLVSLKVPMFIDRYLVYVAPGFALLAAHALVSLALAGKWRWMVPVTGAAAMAITFAPWKNNGLHPSRVAAQVSAWQDPLREAPVLITPYWYKLTFQWHMDKAHISPPPWKNYFSSAWHEGESAPSAGDTTNPCVIVVDAEGQNGARETEADLRRRSSRVDSVEPDKGVWVYRFRK